MMILFLTAVEQFDKGVAPTNSSLYLCYIKAFSDDQIKIMTEAADLQKMEVIKGYNYVTITISSSSHQLVC